jgi:photosystem II stability/assembly factor-like uncharacterized protein
MIHSVDGETWFDLPIYSNSPLQSAHFINPQVGYAVSTKSIQKTSDGGITWTTQYNELSSGFLYESYFLNDSIGFTIGAQALLSTNNGGTTWTPYHERLPNLYSIHFLRQNPKFGYVIDDIGLFCKTVDSGSTWTKKAINFSPRGFFLDVFFVNEKIGFIASTGTVIDGKITSIIQHTTDGGETWTPLLIQVSPMTTPIYLVKKSTKTLNNKAYNFQVNGRKIRNHSEFDLFPTVSKPLLVPSQN